MVTILGPSVLCLLITITYGGGVTKTSGIQQFWIDDFKVFDQVYGKTSDKDLYGATLPPTITFTLDTSKPAIKASEKKARYLPEDDIAESEQKLLPYAFGDRYAKLYSKNTHKLENKKPASSLKFIGVDYNPISESSDPETYNYLKHLENQQRIEFPEEGIGGFTPFANYNDNVHVEDTDAYKSIQDILDAHEANKNGKINEDYDKYLRYGISKGRSKVRLNKGNSNHLTSGSKSKCRSSRCRKRNSSSYRVGTRPYLRRIKHRVVSY